MDLYREIILDHYKHPRNFGTLDAPSGQATAFNTVCGDKITMMIRLSEEGIITDIKFTGEGCSISQASASMLTETLTGRSLSELMAFRTEDILELLGTELTPSRVKCATLPLEVLQKAAASRNTDTA